MNARRVIVAVGMLAAALVGAAPARAGIVVTPTRLDDPSRPPSCPADCSLREAIDFVGPGGKVLLRAPAPASTDTYTLTRGPLTLSSAVSIVGTDARHTVLSAAGASRDIEVNTTGAVSITDLTITGGGGTDRGAGIDNPSASLTLDRVAVSGNRATGTGTAAQGGGLFNAAALTLVHSTVSGNTAASSAGKPAYGGGIYNSGALAVTNTTVAANAASAGASASAFGGGIAVVGPTGSSVLSSATLASNSAAGGGAPGGNLWTSDATVELRNTIVAGGAGASGTENCALTGAARIASRGYNLEDRAQCGLTGGGDQSNTNPQLESLTDNGGPTDTAALGATSAAVDRGNPGQCSDARAASLIDDQRGQPRSSPCDVGAFEGSYPPSFAGPATLSGSPAIGGALGCSPGTVAGAPSTLSYRWRRDGAPIADAATSDYLVSHADAGHRLRCDVTATNHDGSATQHTRSIDVAPDFAGVSPLDTALHLRSAHVRVRLSCSSTAIGPCRGSLAFLVRFAPRRPRPSKKRRPHKRRQRARQIRGRARPARGRRAAPARTLTIGRAGFRIASGATAVLFVRIPGPGQRIVIDSGRRGLRARLETTAWDERGRRAVVTRNVLITTTRRKPRVGSGRRKRRSRRYVGTRGRRPAARRK